MKAKDFPGGYSSVMRLLPIALLLLAAKAGG